MRFTAVYRSPGRVRLSARAVRTEARRLAVTQTEYHVYLVVGQRSVGRSDRAEHVGIEVDFVQRNGVVKAIVKVISHRSTSLAVAGPVGDDCQGTGRGTGPA